MTQFIATQRLDYTDNSDEIASLSAILADIQRSKSGVELNETVTRIMQRLDHLMTTQNASLSLYDQHEERR